MHDRLAIFLCNLKPAKMRGILSEGMIMCGSSPEKVEIIEPPAGVVKGERVIVEGFPGNKKLYQLVVQVVFWQWILWLIAFGNVWTVLVLIQSIKGVPIFISALAISAYRHFFFNIDISAIGKHFKCLYWQSLISAYRHALTKPLGIGLFSLKICTKEGGVSKYFTEYFGWGAQVYPWKLQGAPQILNLQYSWTCCSINVDNKCFVR